LLDVKQPLQPWIEEETACAELGDARLDARFRLLLDRKSAQPTVSIPAFCQGRSETEAAYRFFDNPKVTPDKILAPHRHATLARIRQRAVVLVAQDTTEADLTRPNEQVGGPLDSETRWGFHDHACVAFTPEGTPLGVVHARIWARKPDQLHKSREQKKKENRNKPIDDKESFRWLDGYRQACAVAAEAPQTQVICLSDSEGDVFECYHEAARLAEQGEVAASWIVRACQDRNLRQQQPPSQEQEEQTEKLFAFVASGPVLARLRVEVSKRPAKSGDGRKRKQARQARLADVTVQAATVQLQAPERPAEQQMPAVSVNAVLVRELNPPTGEPPLEWLLLSDLAIGTTDQALSVVEYYAVRWNVEVYFRVLKGGCKIEELQLEENARIEACVALYMIVAWRLLYVTRLARQCPEVSCEVVFAPEEWKAVYVVSKGQPAPAAPPTLGEVVEMVASLGGWLGRKGDGPPGPKVMWIGLRRLADLATAWRVFGPDRQQDQDRPTCVGR
jgi:Transposase Tn5 dimerisation domain/Transposase DNA-binding